MPEESIGGHGIITRCPKRFMLKEKHIFLKCVKSEGEETHRFLKKHNMP